MKKQINDLLLKMQIGENCIGETANALLSLHDTCIMSKYDFKDRVFEELNKIYLEKQKEDIAFIFYNGKKYVHKEDFEHLINKGIFVEVK